MGLCAPVVRGLKVVEDVAEGAQEALGDVAAYAGLIRQEEHHHVLQHQALGSHRETMASPVDSESEPVSGACFAVEPLRRAQPRGPGDSREKNKQTDLQALTVPKHDSLIWKDHATRMPHDYAGLAVVPCREDAEQTRRAALRCRYLACTVRMAAMTAAWPLQIGYRCWHLMSKLAYTRANAAARARVRSASRQLLQGTLDCTDAEARSRARIWRAQHSKETS